MLLGDRGRLGVPKMISNIRHVLRYHQYHLVFPILLCHFMTANKFSLCKSDSEKIRKKHAHVIIMPIHTAITNEEQWDDFVGLVLIAEVSSGQI